MTANVVSLLALKSESTSPSLTKHITVLHAMVILTHLARCLSIQSKHLSELLLTDGFLSVNLVAQDQDRHVSDGLVRHKCLLGQKDRVLHNHTVKETSF